MVAESSTPTSASAPVQIPESVDFTPISAAAAEAIVTFDNGGHVTVTGADGSEFDLVVPPKSVLEDVTVRMTPLADVEGIGDGPVHAVRVEPEGLNLFDFARLTIRPATPIPVDEQVLFHADGDGSAVTAALVDVASEPIVILASHFSVLGAAKVNAQVQFLYGQSARAFDRISDAAGQALQAERKRQLAGQPERPEVWDEVAQLFEHAHRDVLGPLLEAAFLDCAAAQKYIEAARALELTASKVGLSAEEFATTVQVEIARALDAAFVVCEKVAIEQCKAEGKPAVLLGFWLGWDRQLELADSVATHFQADSVDRARKICRRSYEFEFFGTGQAISLGHPQRITWHYWGLLCPGAQQWRIWEQFRGIQQTSNTGAPGSDPFGPILVTFDANGDVVSGVYPPVGNVLGTMQGTRLELNPATNPTQVIATINEGEGPPFAIFTPLEPAADLLEECPEE